MSSAVRLSATQARQDPAQQKRDGDPHHSELPSQPPRDYETLLYVRRRFRLQRGPKTGPLAARLQKGATWDSPASAPVTKAADGGRKQYLTADQARILMTVCIEQR